MGKPKTGKHVHNILSHFWKIDWGKLGKDIKPFIQKIIDSVLMMISESVFPKLRAFAQGVHELELNNHARFGAVAELTHARSLFREMDRIYYQRGLDMGGNPSGYSEEAAEKLRASQEKAKENQESLKIDAIILREAIEHYQFCISKKSFHAQDWRILFRNITNMRISLKENGETAWHAESDSALRALQESIINTLTAEEIAHIGERFSLSDRLTDKVQVVYSDVQDLIKGKVGVNIRLRSWWGLDDTQKSLLQSALKIGQKMHSHLVDQLYAVEEYEQAIKIHEGLRVQDALETLEEEGIIALIEGVHQDDIVKQRTLAVLLADFDGQPRKDYLREAKARAKQFINSEGQVLSFISQVSKHNPEIGQRIALEAYFAGYTKAESLTSLLPSNPLTPQNLCHILDHLPAKSFLYFWDIPDGPGVEEANGKRRMFSWLLTNEGIADSNHSKEGAIKALFDSYQSYQKAFLKKSQKHTHLKPNDLLERQVMNKIGLFMGRLAHADPKVARIIFESEDYRQIVIKECLEESSPKTDRALFFEALVNAFQFNCYNEDKACFIENYSDLLNKNKVVACEIYRARYPNQEKTNADILEHYAKNPLDFCKDIEQFIIKNLSPGSPAEDKMREFFSAVVLSDKAYDVRQQMLELHRKAKGSVETQYLSLLTNPASKLFWEEAQRHLSSEKNLTPIFQKLSEEEAKFRKVVADKKWDQAIISDEVRQQFYTQVESIVKDKKEKIEKERVELSSATTDLPSKCLKFQAAIRTYEQQMEKRLH